MLLLFYRYATPFGVSSHSLPVGRVHTTFVVQIAEFLLPIELTFLAEVLFCVGRRPRACCLHFYHVDQFVTRNDFVILNVIVTNLTMTRQSGIGGLTQVW